MEKTNIKGKCAVFGADVAIWVTDHIKEIGIGVGLLGLAAMSHRAGYCKARREMESGFDKAQYAMLERMVREDGWMT